MLTISSSNAWLTISGSNAWVNRHKENRTSSVVMAVRRQKYDSIDIADIKFDLLRSQDSKNALGRSREFHAGEEMSLGVSAIARALPLLLIFSPANSVNSWATRRGRECGALRIPQPHPVNGILKSYQRMGERAPVGWGGQRRL
jgi:hypothetical protein